LVSTFLIKSPVEEMPNSSSAGLSAD
jgi:hypothetical protein